MSLLVTLVLLSTSGIPDSGICRPKKRCTNELHVWFACISKRHNMFAITIIPIVNVISGDTLEMVTNASARI